MVPEQSKRCTKCGETKPLTEFGKCSFDPRYRNQDRYRPHCKPCRVRDNVEYERRNRERTRATHQLWVKANPDRVRANSSRYYRDNKQKCKALVRRRRARQHAAEGEFTREDVQRIYATQGGRCYYCRVSVGQSYEVDHMVPLVRGGSNWPANLCVACPRCNRRKNRRTAEEFFLLLQGEQRTA